MCMGPSVASLGEQHAEAATTSAGIRALRPTPGPRAYPDCVGSPAAVAAPASRGTSPSRPKNECIQRRNASCRVHHWTDRCSPSPPRATRRCAFRNGHFTMIGLRVNGKPLLRAYSIVSANYEEHLEFLSIKVPDGPLTSRLQHIQVGDTHHRRPQAHRHAADRLPAARQAPVPAVAPAPAWRRS